MNCVVVGRKIGEASKVEIARAVAARTGTGAAVWVLSPT
jgi:hypothetical protein